MRSNEIQEMSAEARKFYNKWRHKVVYHRVGPLQDWKDYEAFAFAAVFHLHMLALVSQPEPRLHKAAERGKLWASRRTTEATDRLGIVYVDDRLLRMVCSEAVPSLDGKRHEWKFFADETARCLRCGLHVPAASAPFHIHNCTPKPEETCPEPMMTTEEPDTPAAPRVGERVLTATKKGNNE